MDNDRIGQVFGNWRLKEQIGWGGMGEVYLAERLDDIVQQTAVKFLRFPGAGFLDEATTLRSIVHQNIVRCFDSDVAPDGVRYLMMEYVKGLPITEYADQKGLTIWQRLTLFLQACDAIARAHQYLILHLDIKPSNILVNKDGVVKVLDFGIARRLDDSGVGESWGACSGPYASPEQIQAGRRLGFAADVYGLGAVLYELLCGHEPFNSRLRTGELERQIAEEIPSPPSEAINHAKMHSVGPDNYTVEPEKLARMRGCGLPEARKLLTDNLDRICLYALRKEPGRRYKAVDQMKVDIARVLKREPPEFAHSNGLGYLAWRTAQRRPILVATVAFTIASSYSSYLIMKSQAASKRASIESRSQIERVAGSTLKELTGELRPKLVSDPRLRRSLELLDAERKALAPRPSSTGWEQIQRDGGGTRDRIRRLIFK